MSETRTLVGRDTERLAPVAVTIEEGLITEIRDVPEDDVDEWLSPGLIDLQVNGFGPYDFNAASPTAEAVRAASRRLAVEGVTTYVPTLVTASHHAIADRLAAIVTARRSDPITAEMIPFVHLEGPHVSGEDGARGVHDRRWVRPPSLAEFDDWQAGCGGLIGMVTLSPHYEGSAEYVTALAARGVHVAIGHTHATHEQIVAAVDAGARLSTHLGNGAHRLLPRHPNYIWSQLADDRLTAGFIGDGHHLPVETFVSMVRAKGLDRSVLVSDSVALDGCEPGRYRASVGGEVELAPSGALVLVGTDYLAGAVASLSCGVSKTAALLGLSTALRLATTNPGRFVGHRGSLAAGGRADLITFGWRPGDTSLHVRDAVVAGRAVTVGGETVAF